MRLISNIYNSFKRYRLYAEFLKELESDKIKIFWRRVASLSKELTQLEDLIYSTRKKIDTLYPDENLDSKTWFSTDIRYLNDGIVTTIELADGTRRIEYKPYKKNHFYDKKD